MRSKVCTRMQLYAPPISAGRTPYYGYDYDDSMEQLDRLESFLVEEFENQEPCEAVKEAMKDLGLIYE